METKTITLLGKEYAISRSYISKYRTAGETFTEEIEAIEIDLKELTSVIASEEDAERIAEEMAEYTYNEAYNVCKSQAEEGEALYAYRTLMISLNGTGRYNSGYISASAMYIELEGCSERSFTFAGYNIDRKDEEDEDGNEIEGSAKYNAILDALKREEFSRRMSERELIDFERLKEESGKRFERLHTDDEA